MVVVIPNVVRDLVRLKARVVGGRDRALTPEYQCVRSKSFHSDPRLAGRMQASREGSASRATAISGKK